MNNLFDLFKNENGDHVLISLDELKSSLDFDKWYFTSKSLYENYLIYFDRFYPTCKIGDKIDVKQLFNAFEHINKTKQL